MADKMTETERLVRAALELHRLAMPAREAEAGPALGEALNHVDSMARKCASEVENAAAQLREAEERLEVRT